MPAIIIPLWALLGGALSAMLGPPAHRWTHASTPTAAIRIGSIAVTVVLFGGLAWRLSPRPELLAMSWLGLVGVQLAATDLTALRLPNRLILPGYMAMPVLLGGAAVLDHHASLVFRSLAGMVILLTFYGSLYLLLPEGQIAAGDAKLAGLLGLALGWTGWTALLTGTLLGWLLATLGYLVRRALVHATHNMPVPLGAYLIFGTFAVLLASPLS